MWWPKPAAEEGCASCRSSAKTGFAPGGTQKYVFDNLDIQAIALSDDGSRIALSGGREVFVSDALAHKQLGGPWLHSDLINTMRFVPGGARLVCLSSDGRAYVWDVATGRTVYAPIEAGKHPATNLDLDLSGTGAPRWRRTMG